MVFKRYIKRHGKKLGPYYYENVRSSDGKVKSVYVGANPHQHPKHKIRKPLFFLILALVLILALGGSLFLIQNKSYVIDKVGREEPDFEVDQILLKVLIRQGESIEKQLRVTNIGGGQFSVSVDVHGLADLVNADSKIFTIKPGQTKILQLNFSSSIAAENIEQQPGIYVGKLAASSEKGSIEIPIIIEIETKNILFDMNLNPVAIERRVKQGSDTTIEVRLFNLENIESQNVDVEYFVKDMNGNTIVTEIETVVVKTQASFFKTVSIPKNLRPGPYVFAAQSKFGNSVGTSSYLFEVVGPEEASFVQFCRDSILCLGLSLSTVLLIIALTAYFYFFMGAYIYRKVTGIEIIAPRKGNIKERKAEDAGPSFFERLKAGLQKRKKETGIRARREGSIKNRIGRWLQERKKRKLEEENIEREKELESIAKEKQQEINDVYKEGQSRELRKFYSILNDAYSALESKDKLKLDRRYINVRNIYDALNSGEQQHAYGKLVELYDKRNDLIKNLEQIGENKRLIRAKEEEGKKKKAGKERISKERKEKIRGIFHRIGLYRTPEEKKQAALQKEAQRKEIERKKIEELKAREQEENRKNLEEQKAEEVKRKREEAEKKAKEAEERKREAEKQKAEEELSRQRESEEKIKQQEIRRKQLEEEKRNEEIRKQREDERIRLQEEKRQKLEEDKKRKELEKQNREKEREERLDAMNDLEAALAKNEEEQSELKNSFKSLEDGLKEHPKKIIELEAGIGNLDSQIGQKSRQLEELDHQKTSASEDFKRKISEIEEEWQEEKNARDAKISELKQKLAGMQSSLMQEMEQELEKLSPAKRKATEKWKRLEIKAKLKIEEQNVNDEIAEYSAKFKGEKPKLEESGKNALDEISKSQKQLKKEIEGLIRQKEKAIRERESISSGTEGIKNKIGEAKSRIHDLLISHHEIKSSLRKARSESRIFGFLSGILPIRRRKAEAPAQFKKKEPKSPEDNLLKEIEEKIKTREEERKSEEEQKRLKLQEKLRQKEEKERQKDIEKELKKQEEPKKKEGWLGKIFGKKAAEESGKAEKAEEGGKGANALIDEVAEADKSQEKPEAKESWFKPAKPKSRKLEKCYSTIDSARGLISRNKTGEAKKLYLEARSLYLGLDYHEKKEVYDELMDLYSRLIK